MGKIPWEVIRRNIPGGGLVACRVPTDHLIVCGVSNWGAYGLAAGRSAAARRGRRPGPVRSAAERELLRDRWSNRGRWWTASRASRR